MLLMLMQLINANDINGAAAAAAAAAIKFS